MPIYKRCCVCGRLCDNPPKSAEPYSKGGYCCNECYIARAVPAIKEKERKARKR